MATGVQTTNITDGGLVGSPIKRDVGISPDGRQVQSNNENVQTYSAKSGNPMNRPPDNPRHRDVATNTININENTEIEIRSYCAYIGTKISTLKAEDIVKQGLASKFFSFVKDCISSLTLGIVDKSDATKLAKDIDLILATMKRFTEFQDNSGSLVDLETLSAAVDASITALETIEAKCPNNNTGPMLHTMHIFKEKLDEAKSQNNQIAETKNNETHQENTEQEVQTSPEIDNKIEDTNDVTKKQFNPGDVKLQVSQTLSSINSDEFNATDKLHILNAKKGGEKITGQERNETVMRSKLNNIILDLSKCRDASTEGSQINTAINILRQHAFY